MEDRKRDVCKKKVMDSFSEAVVKPFWKAVFECVKYITLCIPRALGIQSPSENGNGT